VKTIQNEEPEKTLIAILVVEDDPAVAEALCESLTLNGFAATHVSTGNEAIEKAALFDLVLLDLGLPDLDGLEVCRRIRHSSSVPIIAVTARADEVDRVLGLTLGADDYVVKPYGNRELLARIEALLRRSQLRAGEDQRDQRSASEETVRIGPLEINERTHRVLINGEPIELARKEFAILALLTREPGVLVTREVLITSIWGDPWVGPSRTVDVHVSSLRSKLGVVDLIQTVRGVGYRLNALVNVVDVHNAVAP
jgi:two-component system, OmpR family, response regulator RegX3